MSWKIVRSQSHGSRNQQNLAVLGNGILGQTVSTIDGTSVATLYIAAVNTSPSGVPSVDAYFVVTRATNAPPNSFNLGGLTTGILKHTVSGSVSTPATAVANTDYAHPGAYYVVTRSTDAPSNSANLGALTTGSLRISVSGGVATLATEGANLGTYQFGGLITAGTWINTGIYLHNADEEYTPFTGGAHWGYPSASYKSAAATRLHSYVFSNTLDGQMLVRLYKNGALVTTMTVYNAGATGHQSAEQNAVAFASGDLVEVALEDGSTITTGSVNLTVTVQLLADR